MRRVALAGLLAVAACAGDAEPPKPRSLVVVRESDAIRLDPATITDAESMQVVSQIFEPLVRPGRGGAAAVPCLAERWEVSADGRVWTFHLRKGVRFHDGTPLDAAAVVFSFERQRDPKHPMHRAGAFHYWRSAFGNIVGTRARGPHTVEIRIREPFAPFLANLAMFPASIVSPSAVRRLRDRFSEAPVGTGPYRFVRWDRGREILLARNDRYWGERPQVARIAYRVMRGARRRLAALESGTAHVAHGLAPEDRYIVRLHPDLRLRLWPGNNVAYLAMNTRRAPFTDVRVRRAINHAIDKRALVKFIYQGLAAPAAGPIPPVLWGYNDAVRRYDYDRPRARRLLAEAGVVLRRPLRLFVMNRRRPYLPDPVRAARMIASDLREVGLPVRLVVQPFPIHKASLARGEHDLALHGWVGDNADPDNYLYVLLSGDAARDPGGQNVAFFQDAGLDRLLVRAQRERDRALRVDLYRQAQAIVAERAPWVPIAHTAVMVAARRLVRGLRLTPSHAIYYREVSF